MRDIPLTLQMSEILRRTGIKADSKLKSETETLIGKLPRGILDKRGKARGNQLDVARVRPAILVTALVLGCDDYARRYIKAYRQRKSN